MKTPSTPRLTATTSTFDAARLQLALRRLHDPQRPLVVVVAVRVLAVDGVIF